MGQACSSPHLFASTLCQALQRSCGVSAPPVYLVPPCPSERGLRSRQTASLQQLCVQALLEAGALDGGAGGQGRGGGSGGDGRDGGGGGGGSDIGGQAGAVDIHILPALVVRALWDGVCGKGVLRQDVVERFIQCGGGVRAVELGWWSGVGADGSLMKALAGMAGLRVLRLQACWEAGDTVLNALGSLSGLRVLEISRCLKVTSQGLRGLAGLKSLQVLVLNGLPAVSSLDSLVVPSTLRVLRLTRLHALTDEALAAKLPVLTMLTELDLSFSFRITIEGLAYLQHLSRLRRLNLKSTKLEVATLFAALEHLTDLETLILSNTFGRLPSPPPVFPYLPNLTSLDLSHTHCNDALLAPLPTRTPSLIDLDLSFTRVTPHIALKLPMHIRRLDLSHIYRASSRSAGLYHQPYDLPPTLTSLNLDATPFTLTTLSNLPRGLLTLSLSHARLPPATILPHLAHLPDLQTLTVSPPHFARQPASLAPLSGLTGLTSLTISSTALDRASHRALLALPALARLALPSTELGDAAFEVLARLPGLVELNVSQNLGITDAGVRRLRGCRRLSSVNVGYTNVAESGLEALVLAGVRVLGVAGLKVPAKTAVRWRDAGVVLVGIRREG